MTYDEILHSGMLYHPGEENLAAEQLKRLDMLFEYNSLKPSQQKKYLLNTENRIINIICLFILVKIAGLEQVR